MSAQAALTGAVAFLGGLSTVDRAMPYGLTDNEIGVTAVVAHGEPYIDFNPELNMAYAVNLDVEIVSVASTPEDAQTGLAAVMDELARSIQTEDGRYFGGAVGLATWGSVSVDDLLVDQNNRFYLSATVEVAAEITIGGGG